MKTPILILFSMGIVISLIVTFFIIPKTASTPPMSPFSTFANGGGVNNSTVSVSLTSQQPQTAYKPQATPTTPETISSALTTQQNPLLTPTPNPSKNTPDSHGKTILLKESKPSEVPSIKPLSQTMVSSQKTIRNRNNAQSNPVQFTTSEVSQVPTEARSLYFMQQLHNPFLFFFVNIWLFFSPQN